MFVYLSRDLNDISCYIEYILPTSVWQGAIPEYRFELPGLDERSTYLERWNASLEPEMQVTSDLIREVAEFAEGFSFAYLKELCLSAIMAWIQTLEPGTMHRILREQVEILRPQVRNKQAKR